MTSFIFCLFCKPASGSKSCELLRQVPWRLHAAFGADRVKITFPESFFLGRLAWSCLYQRKAWEQLQYGGQTMLHWCKREVRWTADYVMKAHLINGQIAKSPRPNVWGPTDQFVVMVSLPPTSVAGPLLRGGRH
jgi:hypothetical protein